MAIYMCSVSTISRSAGHSAVGAAAYRAGLVLDDERTGENHHYARKQGGGIEFGLVAPPGAPAWAMDPGALWNAAEAAENRKNSTVAREFLVALPHELTPEQRTALTKDLTQGLVDRFGFAAQWAIHAPDKQADDRNWHTHILATTRVMGAEGLGKKTRELDDQKSGAVQEVRGMVAAIINRHLERAGLASRVDHRTLAEQQAEAMEAGNFAKAVQLDRTPEPKIGRVATAMARKGRRSPRAARVQKVRADNKAHVQAIEDRAREIEAKARAAGTWAGDEKQQRRAHAQALVEVNGGGAQLRRIAEKNLERIDAKRAALGDSQGSPRPTPASSRAAPQPPRRAASTSLAHIGYKKTETAMDVLKRIQEVIDAILDDDARRRKQALWEAEQAVRAQSGLYTPEQRHRARMFLQSAEDYEADLLKLEKLEGARKRLKQQIHDAKVALLATPPPEKGWRKVMFASMSDDVFKRRQNELDRLEAQCETNREERERIKGGMPAKWNDFETRRIAFQNQFEAYIEHNAKPASALPQAPETQPEQGFQPSAPKRDNPFRRGPGMRR